MYRWERAVKIDPTYAAAWNNLAIAYEHEGQFEEARKAYEKAVSSIRKTSSSGRTSISSRKSMTGPRAAAIASLALALAASACTSFYEIPIETPIQAKLDVGVQPRSRRRVHRWRKRRRRREPRNGSLAQEPAAHEVRAESHRSGRPAAGGDRRGAGRAAAAGRGADEKTTRPKTATSRKKPRRRTRPTAGTARGHPPTSRDQNEKDLEAYEKIFANVSFWKKLGEEYQNPLIVTGTVLFTPHSRAAFVQREQEYFDALGRRRVVPVRTYMERKGFILIPTFVFIDGRTGTRLHRESYRKEVLYPSQQNTPALSSYFELMDQVIPEFLGALSTTRIRGTRVLLK